MADKWPTVNGNWSNAAIWNNSTLPTSSDDVYADAKTVTIDQNITVLSLRTSARSGGTAGGGFVSNGNFTISATGLGVYAGSSICLTYTGDITASLFANITSINTVANSYGVYLSGTSPILTITGAISGNSGTSYAVYAIGSNAKINVTGNVTGGGAGTTAYAIYTTGTSAEVNITGTVTGGPGGGGLVMTGASSIATVTGPVIGAVSNNGQGVNMSGLTAQLTVIGDVTGRANNGILMAGASAQSTITGNVIGGSNGGGVGIYMQGATSLTTINGNVTASSTGTNAHAIRSDATSSAYGVILSGGDIVDAQNGTVAVFSRFLRISGNTGTTKYSNTIGYPDGTLLNRLSPGIATGVPAASNVRSGITYGSNNSVTGTLIVPSAANVALGIPVDNTVGTAAINIETLTSIIGAQIAAASSSPSA